MLIYMYLFGLIVGGVLLGASILLGGQDDGSDVGEADAGGDLADGDLADGELADGDWADVDKSLDIGDAGGDFFLWPLRTMRFWTFFLAFFGLTGVTLDGLGLVEQGWLTLSLAIAMGAVSGFTAARVIRFLSRDETAAAADSRDYIGKTVRVVVPIELRGTGKVRLQLKGQTVDVLAKADETLGAHEEAMIIEMEGTTARVARVNGENAS